MTILHNLLNKLSANRELYLLLLIGGIYSLSIALSNTFVNVYLWKQSGEILDLAFYNLMVVLVQPVTFVFAGRLAKKADRTIVLRLGVIFLAAFYLSVLFVGDRATDFLWLLGALLGVGYGFYWLAFNVLTFEITEPETRDFFNGLLGAMSSGAGMAGPILSGFIITLFKGNAGYTFVFGLSLLLFFSAVLLSFSLKRRPAHGKFSFVRIIQERRHDRNWRLVTSAHFFQGLREGIFVFVISILIYLQTSSELALGSYGLLSSLISFIAYYFASRLIKEPMRKKAILAGGLLLYAAVILITVRLSFVTLLIYGSLISLAYPVLLVPYISLTYDVIGNAWKATEMRIEYIVVRELFVHLGRIVSIVGFILFTAFFEAKEYLPFYLLFAGAGHLCIYFFIRKVRFSEGVKA
ncbi:MFS transporter [Bacillus massiliglaciei]|uniref:MFS transporter n=1 Tax=Bacillus massiliglaciei TaxID=1816693 RepID=UPI000A492A4B|nr:MFS transporter [Bacillus massiliglaciei]